MDLAVNIFRSSEWKNESDMKGQWEEEGSHHFPDKIDFRMSLKYLCS